MLGERARYKTSLYNNGGDSKLGGWDLQRKKQVRGRIRGLRRGAKECLKIYPLL